MDNSAGFVCGLCGRSPLWMGLPEARSHTTVVSRAIERPFPEWRVP